MKRPRHRTLLVAIATVAVACDALLGYEKEYFERKDASVDAGAALDAISDVGHDSISDVDATSCATDDPCCSVATAICPERKTCCEALYTKLDPSGCYAFELAACQARRAAAIDAGYLQNLADGAFVDNVAKCLSNLQAIAQADACYFAGPLGYVERERRLKFCYAIFGGAGTDGSVCESSADCVQNAALDEVAFCEPGAKKCGHTVFNAANEPCTAASFEQLCVVGHYCDPTSDAGSPGKGVCVPQGNASELCNPAVAEHFNCRAPNTCQGSGPSTCQPGALPNAPCANDHECASQLCAKGADGGGVCGPMIPVFDPSQCGIP